VSGLLIAVFHLLYITRKTPYLDQGDDYLQIFVSLQLVLTLLSGLLLKVDDPNHRIYEDRFMEIVIIFLTVSVLIIGIGLILFEDVLFLGVQRYIKYIFR
jgi:hypothetical protein